MVTKYEVLIDLHAVKEIPLYSDILVVKLLMLEPLYLADQSSHWKLNTTSEHKHVGNLFLKRKIKPMVKCY